MVNNSSDNHSKNTPSDTKHISLKVDVKTSPKLHLKQDENNAKPSINWLKKVFSPSDRSR